MKKTVVLGASPNPARYSHLATIKLLNSGHEVILLGVRSGDIAGHEIVTIRPILSNVHTITMYLNPARQQEWYDYIIGLQPTRIIFNPGAENDELAVLARNKGIQTTDACTLILLSSNQY